MIKYIIVFENKKYFVVFATELSKIKCYYINKVEKHKIAAKNGKY